MINAVYLCLLLLNFVKLGTLRFHSITGIELLDLGIMLFSITWLKLGKKVIVILQSCSPYICDGFDIREKGLLKQ